MVNTTCHCLSEETGGSSMVIVQGDVDTQVDLVGDWGKEIEFQVGGLVPNSQYSVYVVSVVWWVK